MTVTADFLVNAAQRRVVVPASQSLLTNTDFLDIANNIMKSRMVTTIESVNQEFFVYDVLIPLVAGVSEYSIPYRALGRALRELKMVSLDPNDTTQTNNTRNLVQVALEDAQVYEASALTAGFYFKSDKIRLVPNVPSSIDPYQALQAFYRLPPNDLVYTSQAAEVASVSGNDVTVLSVPSTFVVGENVDFIQGVSGNSILAMDKAITNIAGTTISFGSSSVPSDLVAGDWISLAGTSPVINFCPNEAYPYFESCVAHRLAQIMGDFEGMAQLKDDISEDKKNLLSILEPRIDGEPTIIINRSSLVRGNRFAQRRWLYGGS